MKCYVVSLKRATKRRQSIQFQLNQLGIDFTFFDAVDAKMRPELLTSHSASHLCTLRGAALGCALSHLFIYKKIIESDDDIYLILEDDAVLPKGLATQLKELELFLKNKNNEPTVVQLTFVNEYFRRCDFCITGHTLHVARNAIGTVGYLLNKSAALKLYNFLYPAYLQADCWGWIIDHKIVNVYAVEPPIIKVYDNISTIDHEACYDHDALKVLKKQRPLSVKFRHAFWSSKVIKKVFCKVNQKQPLFQTDDFFKEL